MLEISREIWSRARLPVSVERQAVSMAHRLAALVTDLREAVGPYGVPSEPIISAEEVGVVGTVLTLEAARDAA